MAGIDNNTLLYLRGDSFEDLSLNPKSIINSGFTIEESDMFSKCFYTNNITDKHTNKLSISELNLDLNSDFSIDFMVKPKGANSGGFAILSSNANASIWANNNNAWLLLLKNNKISLTNTVTNTNDIISSNTVLEIDKFYHVELSRCGNMIHIFINGKLEVSVNVGSYVFSYYDFAFGVSDVRGWGANCVINNIRISQLKGHTEDFTPSNQPYNSIDINVTNKTYNQIDFNVTKLGQETINKVEILVNGTVSETYTDSYDSINYLIDEELCVIGENNIAIRVTFDDIYTEELLLTHNITVDELPLETPLLDTVERVKLLTKSKQNEKNMLSNILTSKNVEVSEEDKMSDLIGKVDLLDIIAEKLYLYKDGDECVDVTGGIEILFKWEVANYGNNSFGNKYSNYIRLEANGVNNQESGIGAYTVNKIDLTEYSKLCFEYLSENFTHSYGVVFSASNDKPTSCYKGDNKVAYVFENKNPTNKITTLTIDISQITGSYYISGVARASGATTCNADLNIYKIWLEK